MKRLACVLLLLSIPAIAAPVPVARRVPWPETIQEDELVGLYDYTDGVQDVGPTQIVLSSHGYYACLWRNKFLYEGRWLIASNRLVILERRACEPDQELRQWLCLPVSRGPRGQVVIQADFRLARVPSPALIRQVNGKTVGVTGR